MIPEKSQTINRFGLAMGASAVSAKTAEAAGVINTGGVDMTLADWAIVVTIIGGLIYAANQMVTLYERLTEIRAKRAAAGLVRTPPLVSGLAVAGGIGLLYAAAKVAWWAFA